MPSRVFVTGGSGFVGNAVIDELLSRGHAVNALSHRGSLEGFGDGVRAIKGGLFDNDEMDEGMRGVDAVIHLVGIIMEKPSKGVTFERIHTQGTQSVVDAAKRNSIQRYVHMSALGARQDARSRYHKTKYAAEQYVRESGLDWTIFRPSLIHGPKGEFMRMEAKWARMSAPPFLFMPYFGGRKAGKLQPVYVKDVARAFVDALEKNSTIGEIYPLAGPNEVTWPQLHKTASSAIVGRERMTGWIPVPIAKVVAKMPGAPYNTDQVIMSQENNTTDIRKFTDAFGWEPQPFEPTLRSYAGQM
ncbi:MAG: NAD(P)H-binding protein [Anaerolineae bacterium]|nr:NAD(P)H-binding protein [Phycisphaerae bacterium]